MVEVRTADASVAVMRSGKETELKVNRFTKWTQQQLTQLADALKTNSALTSLNLQCAVAYRLWTDFSCVQTMASVMAAPRRWRTRSRPIRR